MTAQEIRTSYLKFFKDRGHVVIPRANIVPKEDATTLFTGSGMQPMIPYLLGATHPDGVRLADSQVCFRAEDIDEVGDNRHTTSFEMLGNWSLGDYFKEEQVPWMWEFLTEVVKLDPTKLYVTCFIGAPEYDIPKDEVAAKLWQDLFAKHDIKAGIADIGSEADGYTKGIKPGERIFYYDGKKNWWSRNGGPETTPVGDPCGPDSEMFFRFDDSPHTAEEKKTWGEHCHPNCDCGRFMEIGNNVFMAYKKVAEGKFEPLAKPNIDHGSGLERIAAASINDPDVFKISLLKPIIEKLEQLSGKKYEDNLVPMRVIADHLRATTFLAVDGVVPSNTDQGYVMRRFLRRAIRQALTLGLKDDFLTSIVPVITELYKHDFPEVFAHEESIIHTLVREEHQFRTTLEKGMAELARMLYRLSQDREQGRAYSFNGDKFFILFDTYGFPPELVVEEMHRINQERATAQMPEFDIDSNWRKNFDRLMKEQKDRSRTATVGQFKGGLADHSETVVKYHTATHLMYKALRLVLGDHVIQRGSNITTERLRFDFSHPDKMTPEQIKQVEDIVNENIVKDWPVGFREIPTKQAFAEGALGAFGDKYGDTVKVYTMGDPDGEWISKEICGGPHVAHTGTLTEHGKHFKIKKEESSSAGIRRIKAVLE